MTQPYAETLDGAPLVRAAPGARHELICSRLHQQVSACIAKLSSTRLLAPRSKVQLSGRNAICPDLALVAAATGKLWLAAEIVEAGDHQSDTVVKKQLYEEMKLPRLWMVDPRYDNVEVYHGTAYGLVLKGILASSESLTEQLLPGFQLRIAELFVAPKPSAHP
jgi:Uma2 family endonuclease